MKIKNIKSEIINNRFMSQYQNPFQLVRFENEEEVESFECTMSGDKDDNTWNSWVSCKEKFTQFPCWIVCNYVHHPIDDSYTAIYFTSQEVEEDLLRVLMQINHLPL